MARVRWLTERERDPRVRLPWGRSLSEEHQQQGIEVAEWWVEGFTMPEIARKVGLGSPQQVRHRMLRAGVYAWAAAEREKPLEQRQAEQAERERERLVARHRRPPIPEEVPKRPVGFYQWRGGLSDRRQVRVASEQARADQAYLADKRGLHVNCPVCGAEGRSPCVGSTGMRIATWHKPRTQLWAETGAA